jgi:D-alanyl-D-alanine carboxypeptidase (penicillin-binding protein 5/6)
MFLEPGQRVTVRELMLGLAVDSGNDAGLTLAQFLAGSQNAFVAAMNAEAASLGLANTVFYDAYGYDSRNRTTAGDFATFSRLYLASHPRSVEVLHNVRELAYPLAENRAEGDRRPPRTIVQPNRNSLLGAYPGADGLKTGFIEESGYNLSATALRGGQRLVVVLLGVQGRTTEEGSRRRTQAAARLLDFGFSSYPLRPLEVPPLSPVRVWFSQPGSVAVAPGGPTVYPLAPEEEGRITVSLEAPREVEGPLPLGSVVGHLAWQFDGKTFYRVALKTTADAPAAPWWVGFWDALVLFFLNLFDADRT